MASIGHVAVGMAAGRAWAGKGSGNKRLAWSMFAFSVLSLLPDADVIGFPLGVAYDDPWGHRGATHSIVFGLFVAAVTAGVAKAMKLDVKRTFVTAAIVAVSHGLLDSLTRGGLGAALLWPFSDERFFSPIRPLPVAPIGLHMLSEKGMLVTLVELFFFAPFFLYATFPRRRTEG